MSTRFNPSSTTKTNYLVVPPLNFCYVEDTLCKCSAPVSRNSISFFHSISVGCVVNVSGKNLDGAVAGYFEEQGILLKSFAFDGEDSPLSLPVNKLEQWIAEKLETIIFHSSNTNTLIIGSTDNYLDCLLVACLRKVQEWSFVSILAEFRQWVWPHRLFDFEQLIEHFDKNLVDLSVSSPDYLLTHVSLQKEELKMKERLRIIDEQLLQMSSKGDGSVDTVSPEEAPGAEEVSTAAAAASSASTKQGSGSEQERVDRILDALFFSSKNKLLSDGIQFDPALSLINDKDDED